MINLAFETAEDIYGYTATFHNTSGMWKLRGVRESFQGAKIPQLTN